MWVYVAWLALAFVSGFASGATFAYFRAFKQTREAIKLTREANEILRINKPVTEMLQLMRNESREKQEPLDWM